MLNEGREAITREVANTADRPIQVGSHYHFIETNPALAFDRDKARGMHLDIPAGTAAAQGRVAKRASRIAMRRCNPVTFRLRSDQPANALPISSISISRSRDRGRVSSTRARIASAHLITRSSHSSSRVGGGMIWTPTCSSSFTIAGSGRDRDRYPDQ